MYEQSLYKIIEPIKKTTINRLNKSKKWEPIMLLSSLFKIEVKTYQDNQL